LPIEVDQALRPGGQEGRNGVDGIVVRVASGSFAAYGKTQRPTPLGLVRPGCGLADKPTRHGARQGAACGGEEGLAGGARKFSSRGADARKSFWNACPFALSIQSAPAELA
jgi:hypothetical protein